MLGDLWDILTWQVPHNTAVVLRGSTVLGLACGVVGTFLLLRKRSLVADALSHAALPGVCLGFLAAIVLGIEGRPLWILLLGAAAVGLLGVACIHALTSLPRVREDAAIGVVLSVFFAIGIVLLVVIQQIPASHKAGLHHFIFGQAATMRTGDANLIAVLAAGALLVALLAFKEMRLLCFDPAFARGMGYPRWLLDGLLMGLVTAMTVVGLHAVGALLMVALLIIPAAASRFWTDRLGWMVMIAGLFGIIGAYGGVAASAIARDLPTGPAIVVVCGALFLISLLFAPKRGLFMEAGRRWRLRRTMARQHVLRAMYECGDVIHDHTRPVGIDDLLARRRWKRSSVTRVIRRLARHGEVEPHDDGWRLTPAGLHAATNIVRTHRLWEHYLTTHADIAPSHVDRAADDIEHVLGKRLVAELERTLGATAAVPDRSTDLPRTVPVSPHELSDQPEVRDERA